MWIPEFFRAWRMRMRIRRLSRAMSKLGAATRRATESVRQLVATVERSRRALLQCKREMEEANGADS